MPILDRVYRPAPGPAESAGKRHLLGAMVVLAVAIDGKTLRGARKQGAPLTHTVAGVHPYRQTSAVDERAIPCYTPPNALTAKGADHHVDRGGTRHATEMALA
ncbi:MAG: hypothetical protein ACRDGS_12140 [Chloroflexota bacterium]